MHFASVETHSQCFKTHWKCSSTHLQCVENALQRKNASTLFSLSLLFPNRVTYVQVLTAVVPWPFLGRLHALIEQVLALVSLFRDSFWA